MKPDGERGGGGDTSQPEPDVGEAGQGCARRGRRGRWRSRPGWQLVLELERHMSAGAAGARLRVRAGRQAQPELARPAAGLGAVGEEEVMGAGAGGGTRKSAVRQPDERLPRGEDEDARNSRTQRRSRTVASRMTRSHGAAATYRGAGAEVQLLLAESDAAVLLLRGAERAAATGRRRAPRGAAHVYGRPEDAAEVDGA
jgi:hypothetical protein